MPPRVGKPEKGKFAIVRIGKAEANATNFSCTLSFLSEAILVTIVVKDFYFEWLGESGLRGRWRNGCTSTIDISTVSTM